MPKDQRLYMTFPNDFHRHPKVTRLPVEVRWTFLEMNGEARIADNDGIFTAEDAEFLWPADHLTALVGSHPTRPLLMHVGDTYVIREYAEHQQTRAEREELSRKRSEAGRQGGLAKGQASAKQVLSEPKQSQAELEKELTKELKKHSSSTKKSESASRIPEPFILTRAMRDWAAAEVPGLDVDATTRQFVDYWRASSVKTAIKRDWVAAWRYWLRKDSSGVVSGRPVKVTPEERARQTLALANDLKEIE